MRVVAPMPGIAVMFPDEWWTFADMADFTPRSEFYPPDMSPFEKHALAEIEPPARSGIPLFKKLQAGASAFVFQSSECSLSLVQVIELSFPDGITTPSTMSFIGFTDRSRRASRTSTLAFTLLVEALRYRG